MTNHNRDIAENKQKNQMSAKDRFLDYYRKAKKKTTVKSYKRGLELFLEYYGKDADTILKERKEDILSSDFERHKRFDREVEMFYQWELKEGYALSSARTNTLGIIQFFRYFGMPISPNIPMPPPSLKTYIPKIDDLRGMFNVADLRERVILSMGLDLAWRIGDFIKLKISDLPDLNQETPIPIQRLTKKENVISATFLSSETVGLLKSYLPTLKANNPYLLQSNGKGHLDNDSINLILKQLYKKAKVKIPKGKRLTFHSLRKRFLSTAYSLQVDPEHAKLMVGKSIDSSIETYIQDASFRDSFKQVREDHLNLSNGSIKSNMQAKDEEIARLQRQVKELRLMLKGFGEVFGEEILEKALEKVGQQKLIKFETKEGRISKGAFRKPTPLEALRILGKIKEREEKEEYEKLLANNNNH